jgi:hypothetical protein
MTVLNAAECTRILALDALQAYLIAEKDVGPTY